MAHGHEARMELTVYFIVTSTQPLIVPSKTNKYMVALGNVKWWLVTRAPTNGA